MSREQAINWGKWAALFALVPALGFCGGWMGRSVDIWRAPERQQADENRQTLFEDECRTNFMEIHDDMADLKRQLNNLSNQVKTKQ